MSDLFDPFQSPLNERTNRFGLFEEPFFKFIGPQNLIFHGLSLSVRYTEQFVNLTENQCRNPILGPTRKGQP